MENTFCILGKELTFSDEKVNYVKLKREYDRKISGAREMLQEKLPEATEGDIGALICNALITTYKSNKADGTLGKLKEYGAIFNEVKNEILDYGLFKHFIDIRNSYIAEYMQVITNEGENILHQQCGKISEWCREENFGIESHFFQRARCRSAIRSGHGTMCHAGRT